MAIDIEWQVKPPGKSNDKPQLFPRIVDSEVVNEHKLAKRIASHGSLSRGNAIAALDDFAAEISHSAQRVGVLAGSSILEHYHSALVVGIDQCKGIGRKRIEEHLLGAYVVVHSLVEVKMVACEIGENGTAELEPVDAVLHTGMGADLHKGIFTTGLHHFMKQAVEGKMVGGSLHGRNHALIHNVAHCGEQACLVSEQLCHFIEKGGGSGLSVGSGHSHKSKFL